MKIVIVGMMGPGTLEAKIEPLARVDLISEVLFIRKKPGKKIFKTKYISPPLVKFFGYLHPVITPLSLLFLTLQHKPKLIIGYHIVPYGFFAALVGIITNTHYVIAQTGLTIQSLSSNWYLRKLLYWIFKKSLQVNCPGYASVMFWQASYPDIQSKFVVLHSTIDTDNYKPGNDIKKKYDFIVLGRLAPIKRIDLIIRAYDEMIRNHNFDNFPRLVIVGSGPEELKLKNLVSQLNLNHLVTFTGFIENPVILLQQSRFLVMSSVSEGLPTAMMQAMACGVIPVTNLVGNISDLVAANKTGVVHSGQNPEDICEALKNALAIQDTELSIMKQAAREIIVRYHSHEQATKKWANLLLKSSP